KSGRKTWQLKRSKSAGQQQPEPQQTAANPWLSATADNGSIPDEPKSPNRAARGGGGVFWLEHEETGKDTLWRYVLRGGVALLLVMLLVTGLRVWIVDGMLGGNDDNAAAA